MRKRLRVLCPIAVLCACIVLLMVFAGHIDRAVFTSGLAAKQRVIVLDAGHGGEDPGAIGISGVLEKDINLSIALKLRDLLTLNGFTVVMTREEDVSIHDKGAEKRGERKISDMNNRLEIIEQQNNPIFISIHQNRYTRASDKGAQVFYSDSNSFNGTFADVMQRRFVESIQPENKRETKLCGKELFLLYNTKTPSILIECGFLSNEEECALLSTEEHQRKVAFTIYSGLCEFIIKTQTGE